MSKIEYRNLGRSGLRVSQLCLGAMMFGNQTDEATSRSVIASARDAGLNFIDTADVYADGRSEQIVGNAIHAERDRWVVATKVGFLADPMLPAGPDLSRKNLMRAASDSLRRLDTDYIDIYYLHRDDPHTALEETVHALAELLAQGASATSVSPTSAPGAWRRWFDCVTRRASTGRSPASPCTTR